MYVLFKYKLSYPYIQTRYILLRICTYGTYNLQNVGGFVIEAIKCTGSSNYICMVTMVPHARFVTTLPIVVGSDIASCA